MHGARCWINLGLLGCMALLPCSSQGEQKQDALKQRVRQIAAEESLDTAGLQPWHLKLSYDFPGGNGASQTQGTVEEWWAAPGTYRIKIAGSDYTTTELANSTGEYITGDPAAVPFPVNLLREQVVHPGPEAADLDTAAMDLKVINFGFTKLDCIMVGQEIKNVADPPIGLFPTYCLTQNSPQLRATFDFGSLLIARNRIGKFQGREVPIELDASLYNKVFVHAKVETLQTFTPAANEFDATPDLQLLSSEMARVSEGVIAGSRIHGANPQYPVEARQTHTTGTVVLHAIIGRDGHVRRLRVVSTPSGSLAISSLAAVRQWTYRPYLLKGRPVEVDTTITVNYNMGP